jgi:uncharacterized protein (TIGR01777 family)
LNNPPRTLVSLSAAGYYGPSHGALFTEEDGPGEDFLSHLCEQWENAAEPARQAGIRVVHTRMGVVLTPIGGALQKMLPAFRWGLGGRLGTGRQPFCWISLPDALAGLSWAARNTELEGALNLAAPQVVDNRAFTAAIGRALRRPALFWVPAPLLRLAVGQLADAALLQGQALSVEKLAYSGFHFHHPDVDTALEELLDGDDDQG